MDLREYHWFKHGGPYLFALFQFTSPSYQTFIIVRKYSTAVSPTVGSTKVTLALYDCIHSIHCHKLNLWLCVAYICGSDIIQVHGFALKPCGIMLSCPEKANVLSCDGMSGFETNKMCVSEMPREFMQWAIHVWTLYLASAIFVFLNVSREVTVPLDFLYFPLTQQPGWLLLFNLTLVRMHSHVCAQLCCCFLIKFTRS